MISTHIYKLVIVFISFVSFTNSSYAADIENGKEKSAFCQNCHGTNGNSNNPQYPNLAGQRTGYLITQLEKFKSGERTNFDMQRLTAYLSKDDIADISTYFASLTPISAGGNTTLARKGKNKIAVCSGCHGQFAQGRANIPRLAGQHPAYLKKQLQNFKNRSRTGGPMNAITASLSDQDIKEIAAFLSTL